MGAGAHQPTLSGRYTDGTMTSFIDRTRRARRLVRRRRRPPAERGAAGRVPRRRTEKDEGRPRKRPDRRSDPAEPARPTREPAEVPGGGRARREDGADGPRRGPGRGEDRRGGAEAVPEQPHAAVKLRPAGERVSGGAVRGPDPRERVQHVLGEAGHVRIGAGGRARGAHRRADADDDEAVRGEVGEGPDGGSRGQAEGAQRRRVRVARGGGAAAAGGGGELKGAGASRLLTPNRCQRGAAAGR